MTERPAANPPVPGAPREVCPSGRTPAGGCRRLKAAALPILSSLGVLSALAPAPVAAARCSEEIAALESAQKDLDIALHARQSVDAQLHHQPTPGGVAEAETAARQAQIANVIASARRLDAQGKESECLAVLKKAGVLR